jgi:archaemetzincin
MEPDVPDDAYCVIAVTWSDLYPDESYNFVFGLARLTRRVGVFGFARLHPDFFDEATGDPAEVRRLVTRRALAVMSHEVGHMFGIQHCVSFACNMNGSNSLEESDRQPMHLCPVCLRKLHLALGFDPERRYEALEEQYRRAGLEAEAAWVQRQRAFIAGGVADPG